MPDRASFDYAPIWVVPRVDRDEIVYGGLVMRCLAHDYLHARVFVDDSRLQAMCPDLDLGRVGTHLDAIVRVCEGARDAGPVAAMSRRERWHWIIAPRSAAIQVGPVHVGLCDEPSAAFARIYDELVGRDAL